MQKYKFLEHKADAKFRAFGKTLNQQFENSALAMTSIMTTEKIKPKIKKKINIKGIDLKNLLYNFLEEIIFLIDTKNFILGKVKVIIKQISKSKENFSPSTNRGEKFSYQLQAELKGDNLKNYKPKTHIKAVTYNEMKITKNFVQVVVDI